MWRNYYFFFWVNSKTVNSPLPDSFFSPRLLRQIHYAWSARCNKILSSSFFPLILQQSYDMTIAPLYLKFFPVTLPFVSQIITSLYFILFWAKWRLSRYDSWVLNPKPHKRRWKNATRLIINNLLFSLNDRSIISWLSKSRHCKNVCLELLKTQCTQLYNAKIRKNFKIRLSLKVC